jgi:hypothetical protein
MPITARRLQKEIGIKGGGPRYLAISALGITHAGEPLTEPIPNVPADVGFRDGLFALPRAGYTYIEL